MTERDGEKGKTMSEQKVRETIGFLNELRTTYSAPAPREELAKAASILQSLQSDRDTLRKLLLEFVTAGKGVLHEAGRNTVPFIALASAIAKAEGRK